MAPGAALIDVSHDGIDGSRTAAMVLSYPGWLEDKAVAEQYFSNSNANATGSLFHKKIQAMKNKQKLYEGDRYHPDIVALDNNNDAEFTYPSFLKDKTEALKIHTGDCSALYLGGFQEKLRTMRRKEALHKDRHSFPELRELDSKTFTYSDWKADLAFAERQFVDNPNSTLFQKKVTAMTIKQAIFEGDRSHPDIVALDRCSFSYKGFELDMEEALQRITGDCSLIFLGDFEEKLKEMQRKEQAHQDRTRIDELQYLESLTLTYDGWKVDKACAERLYLECNFCPSNAGSSLFQKKVKGMKVKQMLHEGDRTYPDILTLDNAKFTYPEAAWDRQHAEQRITGDCSISRLGGFQDALTEMKTKQEMHTNRRGLQGLQSLDSMLSSYIVISHPPSEIMDQKLREHKLKHSDTVETEDDTSHSSCSDGEERDSKCVVCFEADASHAYIPCGHRCICAGCVDRMDASRRGDKTAACPICRQPPVCVARIFL